MQSLDTSLKDPAQAFLSSFKGAHLNTMNAAAASSNTTFGNFEKVVQLGGKPFLQCKGEDFRLLFTDLGTAALLTFTGKLTHALPELPEQYDALKPVVGKGVHIQVDTGHHISLVDGDFKGFITIEGCNFFVVDRNDNTRLVSAQRVQSIMSLKGTVN